MTIKKKRYITKLYESGFVYNYVYRILNPKDQPIISDIVSEILLMLCEVPESKFKHFKDYEEFRAYSSGLIARSLTKTGRIEYRLRKLYELENYEQSELLEEDPYSVE